MKRISKLFSDLFCDVKLGQCSCEVFHVCHTLNGTWMPSVASQSPLVLGIIDVIVTVLSTILSVRILCLGFYPRYLDVGSSSW